MNQNKTEEKKTDDVQIARIRRYNEKYVRRYSINLNRKYDADLIDFVESFDNKNDLFKTLLRMGQDVLKEKG